MGLLFGDKDVDAAVVQHPSFLTKEEVGGKGDHVYLLSSREGFAMT